MERPGFEINFCFKVLFYLKKPLISTCLCPATIYHQTNDHANLWGGNDATFSSA